MYYIFSYGSNNSEQLRKRIEIYNEEPLSSEIAPAYVDNYTRIFAGYSSLWDGAVASIYPCPSDRIYGTLRPITQSQLERLDNYEGGYKRKIINVVNELTHQIIQAFVYIINNPTFREFPSNKYMEAILTQLHETSRIHKNTILIRALNEHGDVIVLGKWNKQYGLIRL